MTIRKIGVIGIGVMGSLAVRQLLAQGFEAVAYDADRGRLDLAEELGAAARASPGEVAEGSQIVLLLLPGPAEVESVVMDENGLYAGARAGSTVVDMSTVDPDTTRRLARQLQDRGVHYLDAPILGRPSAVGKWVLPVGGELRVLEACRPALQALAREVVHVGPLGSGHALKLLNALMFSAINAMTAEMMAVARKVGIEPRVLYETISGSQAATVSGLFREVGAKIVERDFEPVFPVHLLCKDNGLAVQMAKDAGAPVLLANQIQVINELALVQGYASQDSSALVKVYERMLEMEGNQVS